MMTRKRLDGFTIVELLIVIVVIAIIAAITVVSYGGVTVRARETVLKTDLHGAATKLESMRSQNGAYPDVADDLPSSEGTILTYTHQADRFCVTASHQALPDTYFSITDDGKIIDGLCPELPVAIVDGVAMQKITKANCPASRIWAVDARDNRTYWVQKMADGTCWMLTNLAYAGGGVDTYHDVRTLTNGTGGVTTYVEPRYYLAPGALFTTAPTPPSASTDGTGQYGYLYNWCGAMGGQLTTAACLNATTPLPDSTVSACPAGWRLPTGNGGELGALNGLVNSGLTTTDTGLRTAWLAQRGGFWANGFTLQGAAGDSFYWSGTLSSASSAYRLDFTSDTVNPATYVGVRTNAYAIRCVAQ